MHDPREPHLLALKRILRYLQVTLDLGLLLQPSASMDLVVYTDADWASCPDTRKFTSGYAVYGGTTSYLGLPSVRRLSRGPERRLNIAQWQMELPRLLGCASFFRSSAPLLVAQRWLLL